MSISPEQLPSTWLATRLSDIAHINPKLDKAEISEDLEVSFVPMPAVQELTGRIDLSTSRHFTEVKKGYTPFLEGDVLFAKITPCMENGKMAVVPPLKNGYGFGSTEFHVLRPFPGIDPKYLYYFVSSQQFRADAEHNMTGAVGQRRVPTVYLSGQCIPIAPSTEQRRIVTKIEELFSELDNGAEALTTAHDQLKTYRQSVLKYAFDGKLTAELRTTHATWQNTCLGHEIEYLTSGSRGWAGYYADSGDTFIRAQNLKYDRLDLTDIAFVKLPEGNTEGLRTRVKVGDVLITITGANVTKTGVVESDLSAAYVSQHVALCRPRPSIMSRFLYWYLLSEAHGRRQLSEAAYGAGKPGLNLDNIRSVTLSLPSPPEQAIIVERIEAALSVEQNLSEGIDSESRRTTALRACILKQAFSGQLVTQDPTDEPASVLVERTRAEREGGVRKKMVRKRKKGNNGKRKNRMSTFDSTKTPLPDIIRAITEGKVQLPDFQRGWVWDDEHVRSLLVSVARSFPVGAVMLLETGGDVRFQVRPIENLTFPGKVPLPERLILDGQQRLTTLTQVLALDEPVKALQ